MQKKSCISTIVENMINKNRTLKISLLLIAFAFFNLHASSYSQTKRITLNVSDVPIESVLSEIEEKSEFKFFFKTEEIDVKRQVSINVTKKTIADILKIIFNDGSVDYSVVKKQIVLKRKKVSIPKTSSTKDNNERPKPDVPDQQTVTGLILDGQGVPLPGASIVEKGTTNGVAADFDGNFSITVSGPNSVLVFSSIGFAKQEITVGSQTNITVTMKEDAQSLDEVVIVGYGTQKKSNVTGAISTLGGEDLENRMTEGVAQSMQGKLAGVQVVTTSGAPNSSPSFRIRGYSSTGSSNPLYIVDGLRVTDIGYLNQDSVESIEILKDASSAAIYGAEAGNGVVLITTKKGSRGSNQIFYNMQTAISSQVNRMEMMNADQFKEYWLESGRAVESSFGTANTDWQDVVFNTGLIQRHTIGFQGNNDDGSLYIALSYLKNNGMVVGKKDMNERFAAQINATYDLTPWLSIGTNNSIERGYSIGISENSVTGTGSAVGGAYYYDPTVPVVYENESDVPQHLVDAENAGFNVFRRNGKVYGDSKLMLSNLWNPLGMIDYQDDETWRTNINGVIFGTLKPATGLTFTSRLGYRINNTYHTNYTYPYYWNANQRVENGSFQADNIHNFYYQVENFANYNNTFGKHDFSVVAGMQYISNRAEYQLAETNLLINEAENYRYLDYSSPDANDEIEGNINKTSSISYFGRLGWTYDERYTLQGVFRADAYDLSKLSAQNRWGYFPAFSASWNVSNEKFMENIVSKGTLNSLKFRASWGINGNISSLNNYPYIASLGLGGNTSGSFYSLNGSSGLVTGAYPASILSNANLSWEESRQTNVGLDARLFDNHLSITADYFVKNTTDMLSTASAPAISGATTQTLNAGKIRNSGLEFDFSYNDQFGKLRFGLDANFATVENEVIESPYGAEGRQVGGTNFFEPVTYFEAGYPVWYIRTFIHDRIDEATGLPVYKTAEELGTDDGRDFVGSGIPDFTYGLTLDLAYEGLDLKVFGSGVAGNQNFLAVYRPDLPIANLPEFIYTDRWTPSNTGARLPRANQTDGQYAASDFWVYDASYFKIRQIQLGYSLPSSILESIGLSSMRAFVSLENFFVFTKYPGNDPESVSTVDNGAVEEIFPGFGLGSTVGLDRVSYPAMKQIVFGLNVKL